MNEKQNEQPYENEGMLDFEWATKRVQEEKDVFDTFRTILSARGRVLYAHDILLTIYNKIFSEISDNKRVHYPIHHAIGGSSISEDSTGFIDDVDLFDKAKKDLQVILNELIEENKNDDDFAKELEKLKNSL